MIDLTNNQSSQELPVEPKPFSVVEGAQREAAADELIASLSNSYENRRARQASAWERLRRNNLRKAS